MRNVTAIRARYRFFWNLGETVQHAKSSLWVCGGVIFLLVISWLGGCSASSTSTSDPSKQEVQTDSDRFFKNLEKEETKKEAKEAQP